MPPVIENPSDFKVDGAPTSTSITVSWTHSSSEPLEGFRLWHHKRDDAEWGEPVQLKATDRKATVEDLQPDTAYEFRIHSYAKTGSGKDITSAVVGPIDAATAGESKPDPGAPAHKPHAPWGLAVDGFVSPQTVPLQWSYGDSDPDHFLLFWKPSSYSEWNGPEWVNGHKRYQDVWNLPNTRGGDQFDFRLAAVDADDAWSEDVRLHNVHLPYEPMGKALPDDVNVTDIGRTAMTIKWNWSSIILGGFKVYYRPEGNNGAWSIGGETLFVGRQVRLTGLTPATTYVVRVYGWVWHWGKTYYSNPSTDMTISTAA